MTPSLTSAAAVPSNLSERDRFFAILTHDDWNSRYIVSTDESGSWRDVSLPAAALPGFRFAPGANYYVTRNGFTGRRRLDVRTRQLNSIFLDVDFHDRSAADSDAAIAEVLRKVGAAVAGGVLPQPTMVVNSGRGVHLYYVLQRSVPYRVRKGGEVNEQGISYFSHVQEQLADVLDEVIAEVEGAKVDRAVFDFARVSRIPGTFNVKAGRYARLVNAEEVYYHLPELDAYKPEAPNRPATPPAEPRKRFGVRIRFDRLMLSRLSKIAELQEHRGFACEGHREMMAFVYYNSAVQVYERDEAWERLLMFNARFLDPLPESELRGIESAVTSVVNVRGERGYYVLKAASVARFLGLTEKEAEETGFFASKRVIERIEAKRRTAERRSARNERIIALRKEGMGRREIAAELGISLSTVHGVLKDAGLTRTNKRAASEAVRIPHRIVRGSDRHAVEITAPASAPREESCAANRESLIFWQTSYGVVNEGELDVFLARNSSASDLDSRGLLGPDDVGLNLRHLSDDLESFSCMERRTLFRMASDLSLGKALPDDGTDERRYAP